MQEAVIALQAERWRPRVLVGGQAVVRHPDIVTAFGACRSWTDDQTIETAAGERHGRVARCVPGDARLRVARGAVPAAWDPPLRTRRDWM